MSKEDWRGPESAVCFAISVVCIVCFVAWKSL